MSEFNSTLDLVDNEELKISDCWIKEKQQTQPVSSSENGLQESGLNDLDRDQEIPRSRRKKLPSIVEGDFSPLGITSLKQSFFDKIREARSKSSNEWSFLITFLRVTCGPCFWAFCLVTTLIAPLLMLLIGSALFNECPSHPSLPPLLIIIGLITCLGNLVNIVDSFIGWKTIFGFNRQNGDWTRIVIVTNIAINTCDTILTIIFGFIIGFTSKPSANYVDGRHYCNPVVYKFSYWFVTLIFIYAALIIILLAVSLALVHIKTHFNTNRDSSEATLFRVPMPHQLGNIIDLLAPIHIRLVTDGVKHHPVVRFPVLDLISRGQIFNKPGIHHLIHGPGIPW